MKRRLLLLPALSAVLIGLAACASPTASPPDSSGSDEGVVSEAPAAPEVEIVSPASDETAFCTWLDGIKTFQNPSGEPWHTTSADAGCTWPNAGRQYVTLDLSDKGSAEDAEAYLDRYTANGAVTSITIPGTSRAGALASSNSTQVYAAAGNWFISCLAANDAGGADQCAALISAVASEYAL